MKTKQIYFSKFKNYSVLMAFITPFLLGLNVAFFRSYHSSLVVLCGLMISSSWWVFMHIYLMTKVSLKTIKRQEFLRSFIEENPDGLTIKQIARAINSSPLEAFVLVDLPRTSGFDVQEVTKRTEHPLNKRKWIIKEEAEA